MKVLQKATCLFALSGDQPKALGPHLDYHPNATARRQFHEEFGAPIWFSDQSEANILMGDHDKDGLEFKTLLGVWKPVISKPICDFPLAGEIITFRVSSKLWRVVHRVSKNAPGGQGILHGMAPGASQ